MWTTSPSEKPDKKAYPVQFHLQKILEHIHLQWQEADPWSPGGVITRVQELLGQWTRLRLSAGVAAGGSRCQRRPVTRSVRAAVMCHGHRIAVAAGAVTLSPLPP